MNFNDLVTEHNNSVTLGYPRRMTEQCKCGRMHTIVIRHAGYGRQKWYELADGKLVTDAPCKLEPEPMDATRAAVIRVITGTAHPAVVVSRETVRHSFNSDEEYERWLANLPSLEQEQDETVAFFLQGTGRF